MRKKLVATSSSGGSTYEITVDDARPAQDIVNQAATLMETSDGPNQTQAAPSVDVPEEAKAAALMGDIDRARQILEQAGFTVDVQDLPATS